MKKIILLIFIFFGLFMIGCKTEKEKKTGDLYINYILNNGSRDVIEKVDNLDTYTLLKVERVGYRFSSWYYDEELEVKLSLEDLDMPTGEDDKIVYAYAKWYKEQYKVSFICDGKVINTQFVEYGQAATSPTPLDISGYQFSSWDVDFSKVVGDMEVNAIYKESNEKNIMVVLGNWMNDDGTISATMKKRLDLALVAYTEFEPAYIVVTGGMANSKAGITEAQAMYDYLVDHGIDGSIIIKEDQSMSTNQNAIYTMKKLENLNFKNLIIVSTIEHFVTYGAIKYFNDAAYNNTVIRKKNINILVYTNNDAA